MNSFKKDIKSIFIGIYSFIVIILCAGWLFTCFGVFIILGSLIGKYHYSFGIMMFIFNFWMIISRYTNIKSPLDYMFKYIG